MRMVSRILAALAAALISTCATTPDAPSAEVKRALAPTGKLRVVLLQGSPVHAVKDAATGEWRGVSYDLGKDLAARLGVAFEPVFHSTVPAFVAGTAQRGDWDIAFLGVSPERAKVYDFSGRHMDTDFGYLVGPGSSIRSIDEVDRSGMRVVVVEQGSPDVILTKSLRNATLVRVRGGFPQMFDALKNGKADVVGAVKDNLRGAAAALYPEARILDGRPGYEPQALAMPKGRGAAAMEYTRRFIEAAKADGRVKSAIERAGLRAASVASDT